ncbi:MGMT family protein [Acinetobacter radioresistens]
MDFKEDVISSAHELYGQILEVISLIPCGKVATYGQVARLAGLPKHARLVGYILKNLPIGTDIPWHRVINSLSKLNTQGQNIQSVLLIEEGLTVINGKINLKKFQWLP